MGLFRKAGKGVKKWHVKAMMVDPHATRITFVRSMQQPKHHLPPWIYERQL